MGDHESYGSCMLWFSEMDVSPQSLDECPKRISIPLAGPGAMEGIDGDVNSVTSGWGNDSILSPNIENRPYIQFEACICPSIASLHEIEKKDQEAIKERLRLREELRVREQQQQLMKEQAEKEEMNRQKLRAIDEAKARDDDRTEIENKDHSLSKEDVETVKSLVQAIVSTGEDTVVAHVDRHGTKFRAYLSLAKLARETSMLRTLVGRQMYGGGLSMALADLAHKMERVRCAAAALLASLGHDGHERNMRLLKAHSGFQIDDIHVFWVPESLRDAYLDAGSRLTADAAQRERDGRRKIDKPSWWPPSEKGFVEFLRTKLSRALSRNVGALDDRTFCDHTDENSPVQLICFPPAKPFMKDVPKGKGMAWFLSVLQEQLEKGNMFALLEDLKENPLSVGPSVEDFEDVLMQYEFRQGINDNDFQRFVSIFIQNEKNVVPGENDGVAPTLVNLEEMKRALKPKK